MLHAKKRLGGTEGKYDTKNEICSKKTILLFTQHMVGAFWELKNAKLRHNIGNACCQFEHDRMTLRVPLESPQSWFTDPQLEEADGTGNHDITG